MALGKRKKSSRKADKVEPPSGGESMDHVELGPVFIEEPEPEPKVDPKPKPVEPRDPDLVDDRTRVFVSKNSGAVSCLAGVITDKESRRRGGLLPQDFPGGVKTVEDMLAAGRLTR